MSDIFFSSDTHFQHNKPFIYEPRGFNSVDEMNEIIVQNWNSIVKPCDIVYLLGDVVMMDNNKGISFLERLNGNIYIAIGNHDTENKCKLYEKCKNVKNVQMGYNFGSKKMSVLLTHYPTIVSNFDNSKRWNFHGHTHSKNKFCEYHNCYNVALDAHNNFPISFDDIKRDIIKWKEQNYED